MTALQLYGKFGANIGGGEASGDNGFDFLSDTIKATLHTTTYAPNVDTNEAFTDATNELTTANGYTAGGVTLGTKTVTYNATGGVTTYSCATFSWTASGAGIAFRYLVVWDDTSAAPADMLIGYFDYTGSGNTTIPAGSTITFDPTASGLFTATVTGA